LSSAEIIENTRVMLLSFCTDRPVMAKYLV